MKPKLSITHIDTACILLDINGYKILTDPTLDRAGGWYYHGYGAISRKTDSPAVQPEALHNIDLVLLSHHQHKDNFDNAGKELTLHVGHTISTPAAAKVLADTIGLAPWQSTAVHDARVPGLTITATPAQHGPGWLPTFVPGHVIGFVIAFDGQPDGVIYITGDTVYFSGIEQVAQRYKVDVGIYHVSKVQFKYLTGAGKYTMDAHDMARAISVTRPRIAIPIHYRGWSHFQQSEQALKNIVDRYDHLKDVVRFLEPGVRTEL